MTREEAIECAKNMTYQDAVRNTVYAKGVKKATRIKLHELAEIADKLVLCKYCQYSRVYQTDSKGTMKRNCVAFVVSRTVTDDDFCSWGERSGE